MSARSDFDFLGRRLNPTRRQEVRSRRGPFATCGAVLETMPWVVKRAGRVRLGAGRKADVTVGVTGLRSCPAD